MKLAFNAQKIEVAKRVTLPFIKQKVGSPVHIYFVEPYHISTKVQNGEKGEATLAHVINLENGQESEMLLSTVTKTTLDENYTDNGYVGKAFRLELFAVEGKKYHKIDLVEIKLDPADKKALDDERAVIMGLPAAEEKKAGK